ncbi:hypothetical protein ACLOAV_010693 [Pseudogymnoascus australis]
MKAQVRAEDLRFETERRLFCKGSALVKFESLNWEEHKIRQHDPKNVLRLKRIFEKEGCRSLKVGNHIPAIVDQHHLDTAIENAKQKGTWNAGALPSSYATIDTENGYPELEFPGGINCLHGFHRIQAGKKLCPAEKWWIVDLYLSGISYEMRAILDEEYSNEERPCDGQIYRKIREYQYLTLKADTLVLPATCVSFEMRWWSRFNESRQKKLRGLFGLHKLNRLLAAAFDALSKIPALFDAGMKVTTLNTVMATRCYEEIQHYLNYIFTAFVGFFDGIENGIQRLDKATVRALERKAPAISASDSHELSTAISNGAIFSGFSSEERSIIWGNILKFRGIIPSLSTFFEDILLLEACVNCIRWLVTVPTDQTLFTALGEAFQPQEGIQCGQVIQTSDTTFHLVKGNPTYCMKLAYLQMIAFAMRDYRDIPKQSVKKNLTEIARPKADIEVLQKGASFAKQLGYSTPEIERLEGMEPLIFSEVKALAPVPKTAVVEIKRRSGKPHTDTFEEDRRHIFIHNLLQSDEAGEGITSFYVLKSWFNAFFGTWAIPVPNTNSNISPPKDEEVKNEVVNLRRTQLQQPGSQNSARAIKKTKLGKPKAGVKHIPKAKLSPTQKMEIDAPPDSTPQKLIRFVEQDGNATESLDQLLFQLWVKDGDPHSLVEKQVIELKDKGKRICDKHKRHIAADQCYNVATMAGNNNTLFVISEIKPEDKHWGEDFEPSVMDAVEYEHKELKPEEQARRDLYSVPEHEATKESTDEPTQEVKDASQPALHKTTLTVDRKKGKRETKTPYTREKVKPQKQAGRDLYSVLEHLPTEGVKVEDDNQSTLHNVPAYEPTVDKQKEGRTPSVGSQKCQEIKPEEQARRDLYSVPSWETAQKVKLEDEAQLALYNVPAFQEQPSQEDEESDSLLDLLGKESENATNAQILDQNTVIIHLKTVIQETHYVSKPAKDLQCIKLDLIEVPTGDPQEVIKNRMIFLHETEELLPHDSIGRTLSNKDCYEVAINADDHTLYMIKEQY